MLTATSNLYILLRETEYLIFARHYVTTKVRNEITRFSFHNII